MPGTAAHSIRAGSSPSTATPDGLHHPHDGDAPATLWFLVTRVDHLACGRWTLVDGELLRCACGTALYAYREPQDGVRCRPPVPPDAPPGGGEHPMTPPGTAPLVSLVAAVCPSTHLERTTAAWLALLADLDVADARAAAVRLGRRQRRVAAADIHEEVRTIREERLARDPLPLPGTGPDDPHRHRAELLSLVEAIASGRRIEQLPAGTEQARARVGDHPSREELP